LGLTGIARPDEHCQNESFGLAFGRASQSLAWQTFCFSFFTLHFSLFTLHSSLASGVKSLTFPQPSFLCIFFVV
jgi:hypothetical protein